VKLEAEQAAEQEIRDLHARDHAIWDKVADIRARFGERDRQIGGMLGSAESLAADDDVDLRQHRLLEGSSATVQRTLRDRGAPSIHKGVGPVYPIAQATAQRAMNFAVKLCKMADLSIENAVLRAVQENRR
jgi:hypothetical protein